MGPAVAVEVRPAPDAGAPTLRTLLDACSQALPEGACHAAADVDAAQASGLARVTWQDSSVLIEVRLGTSERWLGRGMYFAPEDKPLERWRTVGLTIATIVDQLQEEQQAPLPAPSAEPAPAPPVRPAAAPSPPTPAPAPKPAPKPLPPLTHAPPAVFHLEAGALFQSSLSAGTSRVGPYLRFAPDLGGIPAFVDASVDYAIPTRPGEPTLSWFDATVGGGWRTSPGRIRFELGLAGVLNRTSASAADPETGEEDSAQSWLPGLRTTARLTWPEHAPIAAVLGLTGSWVARELVVTNAGEEVGRLPAYSGGFVVGLRVSWAR